MKFKVFGVVAIIASIFVVSQGLPFGDFGLTSVAEFEEPSAELKRDKRTLTTICVEIKPSSPYEEPYFMCKGTDAPQFSKGSSDSHSFPSKPSYKPKPSPYGGESDSYHSGVKNDYHASSKPEYHADHLNYDKPPSAYDSSQEYSTPSKPTQYEKKISYSDQGSHQSSYQNYEAPKTTYAAKPSYASHHDNHDEYSKPQGHKLIYEKPSVHHEPIYSPKPQSYNQHSPAYDHKQTAGYSKPSSQEGHIDQAGYSKPSSSYESHREPTGYSQPSSYDHSSPHDLKPVYNGEGHIKPTYGHGGHSYSAEPESKPLYSKPSSYSSKQTSYGNAEHSQHAQPMSPSYNEQKLQTYSKPTHQGHQETYSKPAQYILNEHIPTKTYTTSEKDYNQHSGYAPISQNYRMMPQELMQTPWESQPYQLPSDGLGYRVAGAPIEYQNYESQRMMNHEPQQYTGLEGPLRFDLSGNDQEAPILQSPYQLQHYPPVAHSYGPVVPTYSPPAPYVQTVPSYPAQTYPQAAPSYAPVATPPAYVPSPAQYGPAPPSYAPATTSYAPTLPPPQPVCPQSYLYSFQPVIMSLPCISSPTSYSSSTAYSQSLGTPADPSIERSQQFYPSNINPLQDHTNARSGGISETNKDVEENSRPQESKESEKKSDTESEIKQTVPKKSEIMEKTDLAQEKPAEKKIQEHEVGLEKPKEAQITIPASPKSPAEGPNTKEAYNAMMRMAKIAAIFNKDDPSSQPSDAAGPKTVQGNDNSSGGVSQPFPRSK